MMLNVRRLTGLTKLSLAGFPNLVGDAPVAALAMGLPPQLATLQLAGVKVEEEQPQVACRPVGKHCTGTVRSSGMCCTDTLHAMAAPMISLQVSGDDRYALIEMA